MEKAFTRVNWENTPSMATPLNEDNLNEGDAALDIIDDRVISLDLTKANQSDLLQSVKTITYDTTTGVFVFTWWNGTTLNVDLNIEKIPVTFSMDANGVITMTTADGSTYTADVGSLIKQYSFVDSSEIDFTVTVDAQTGNKSVTAEIKDGSITGQKLQPNYLADVTTQAQQASSSATSASGSATNAHNDALLAQSYAVGTGGTVRTGDATDNAKYYKEQAEQAAADASAAAHVSTMTLSTNGIGRPDGTTITVDANGVFTATSGQVFIYPDPNVLPSASTANDKAIYLIDDPTATGADICTEWVVVTTNGVKTWKQIGDTSVDLSGYATTTQLNTKVNKTDIANIEATGTTNTTGSTIDKDTYFWLNGNFVQALTDIAVNATFTANSNYKVANDVLNSFEGGSGGHTIENASGTALTQRDTLQFKGGLSVSDDSTNEVTVVTDTVPEIEWSVWNAMTPQEQEAIPNAIILNAPDGGGGDTSACANKTDISSIILTGTTNTSGDTITAGTWFYLNGEIVKAKVDIASNATFTKDTNYEEKTIGEELSELNSNSAWQSTTLTFHKLESATAHSFTVDAVYNDSLLFVSFQAKKCEDTNVYQTNISSIGTLKIVSGGTFLTPIHEQNSTATQNYYSTAQVYGAGTTINIYRTQNNGYVMGTILLPITRH